MKFAGKDFETMEELARLAVANPSQATETFRVAGNYGNVPHGHLEIERGPGFGSLTEVGVMAYEDLLVAAIRCVGSDYIEYTKQAGVIVDSVRLEITGIWDVRGMGPAFGLKAPSKATPAWNEFRVRATVRTNASKAQAEKAHRFAWENNVAAASLAAVPVRHEVTIEPLARIAAR